MTRKLFVLSMLLVFFLLPSCKKGDTGPAGQTGPAGPNALGQAMAITMTKNADKQEADISRLPGGLYYVIYKNGEHEVSGKFVKQ